MHFNTEAYKKLFPRQEKPKVARYENAVEDDTETRPVKKAAEAVTDPESEKDDFSPEEEAGEEEEDDHDG